jgi:hypothetical protein
MTNTAIIRGRARVAFEAHKSERTISRWIQRGILQATKDGPFANNLLEVRAADLERVKRMQVVES